MKRWIVLSLLFVPFLAAAAGFWDGNAALQRGDATFESGLYATSNSFPPGTQITIQNQDTGKTVTATITGRIEGQSDILVLLSPKTAQALDLPQGTLGRVRVTVPPKVDSTASAQPGDQTASSDPDVNPAAAYGGTEPTPVAAAPTAAPATTAPVTAAPSTETPSTAPPATTSTPSEETLPATTPAATAPEETPAATPEAPTQEQPQTTPQTATASTTPAPSSADADNAAIISAAQSRTPQKQVFQPPREDEKFVYHPEQAPTQTAVATTPTQGSATITGVDSGTGVTPPARPASDMALADVVAPEESRPQEIVSAGTAVPAPAAAPADIAMASPDVIPENRAPQAVVQAPRQTEVTGPRPVAPADKTPPKLALLPPEAPKPAQAGQQTPAPPQATAAAPQATTTTAVTTTKPPVAVQTATSLPKTGSMTYFLQLAAYGNETLARELAAKLASTYPALVLTPPSQGTTVFKVVIGPLNRAESGTLLTWFRYRGFPDAFLKQE
jgi:cell division septation protein DedD